MRVFLFATASVALALEEADHADVEESLSLLQLSARPRSVAENSDDLNAHDVDDLVSAGVPSYPITWDIRRGFGPDGTWATPFCKNIQGCTPEERVCPAGCDGMAYWQPTNLPNSRLGINRPFKSHFIGCIQGMNRGGAFGSWHFGNHWQNCNNGPDSKKPSFWEENGAKDAAWVKQNIGNPDGGCDPTQTGYGQEWCPKECVNDCAAFKNGQYFQCGSTGGLMWYGYNRQRTVDVGPNPNCPVGEMKVFGAMTFTWCGEPTTTTTTTPPPPPPPPVEEPVVEPDGDEANAIGDPHLTSNTGHHFDLQ